jgi:hypothetical protein
MQTQLFSNSTMKGQPAINASQAILRKSRWVAHVSVKTKLAASHRLVLNIKPTASASAFDIIERLLFAKTCAAIFCDETLPLHQVKMLKQMAMFSGTEVSFIADKAEFNSMQAVDLEKA